MTTRARKAEADRAAVAFHAAITQIGVTTVGDALDLWQDVPPLRGASSTGTWLGRAVRLVLFRRRESRDLARAYYRLVRALHTGATIPDPAKPDETSTTLAELRSTFSDLAGEHAARPQEGRTATPPSGDTPVQESPSDEAPLPEEDDDSELDRILIEEIERLREDEAEIEREAERELQLVLNELGPKTLDRHVDKIGTEAKASDVDRLRDEAHAKAGARQAAAAERVAMNGARSTVWSYASKDKRAIGYVRLSRTGTPCGWCAMLISRGAVYRDGDFKLTNLYRSEQSAEFSDGDKYHDNCHCYAEPIFSREQYSESDLFALNREYSVLWPQVTKGLSGKAALSAWRYYMRQEQARKRAQVVRSPNVQEA